MINSLASRDHSSIAYNGLILNENVFGCFVVKCAPPVYTSGLKILLQGLMNKQEKSQPTPPCPLFSCMLSDVQAKVQAYPVHVVLIHDLQVVEMYCNTDVSIKVHPKFSAL